MNPIQLYKKEIPVYLLPFCKSEEMQRLKRIDMNCGMNFTSFPLFRTISPYTRYEHSLGTAIVLDQFTTDKKQVIAALFHDIATPAFSHVIDFMHHDYVHQEATEYRTHNLIASSCYIVNELSKLGLTVEDVDDYHRYSLADNDSPKLSSDRLEYTIGNSINYHLATEEEMLTLYYDINVSVNEFDELELCFLHEETALRFASLALKCGRVYGAKEDRYGMEVLARLIKRWIHEGILKEEDLYVDESYVIDKIRKSKVAPQWDAFCNLDHVDVYDYEVSNSIQIHAKKRYIDPYVIGRGRCTEINVAFAEEVSSFLKEDQTEYIRGDIKL